MIPSNDQNLIKSLQQNDRSAIDTIFLKYHSLLCRVSLRIVNDTEAAKDVVQEVFIKLWRNRKELSITVSLEAYLKRAVVNTSLNYIESKKKFTSIDQLNPHIHHTSEDHQQSADELSSRIDGAVNQLPIRTKAVFTLIRYEDLSYKEVSESLNISLKAVEKEMMKALRLLREMLKDYLPLLIVSLLSIA